MFSHETRNENTGPDRKFSQDSCCSWRCFGLTLGVQYYVNLRAVRNNAHLIFEQEQSIMTGVALGVSSLQSDIYLDKILGNAREPLFNEQTGRVKNVMVVDEAGNVRDSIIPEYTPREREDKTIDYYQFKDVPLPPLRSAVQFNDSHQQLPRDVAL